MNGINGTNGQTRNVSQKELDAMRIQNADLLQAKSRKEKETSEGKKFLQTIGDLIIKLLTDEGKVTQGDAGITRTTLAEFGEFNFILEKSPKQKFLQVRRVVDGLIDESPLVRITFMKSAFDMTASDTNTDILLDDDGWVAQLVDVLSRRDEIIAERKSREASARSLNLQRTREQNLRNEQFRAEMMTKSNLEAEILNLDKEAERLRLNFHIPEDAFQRLSRSNTSARPRDAITETEKTTTSHVATPAYPPSRLPVLRIDDANPGVVETLKP